MNIKSEILENSFAEKLRMEIIIDREAFLLLCDQLARLAVEWRQKDLVDKQLVQELYVLPTIIKGAADGLREHKPTMAAEIDEMAYTIDGLIIDALA